MARQVIHVSEKEATRDFASLLKRVRAGAEVVIEKDAQPVAVVHPAEPVRRTISECIVLAKAHEEETNQASWVCGGQPEPPPLPAHSQPGDDRQATALPSSPGRY